VVLDRFTQPKKLRTFTPSAHIDNVTRALTNRYGTSLDARKQIKQRVDRLREYLDKEEWQQARAQADSKELEAEVVIVIPHVVRAHLDASTGATTTEDGPQALRVSRPASCSQDAQTLPALLAPLPQRPIRLAAVDGDIPVAGSPDTEATPQHQLQHDGVTVTTVAGQLRVPSGGAGGTVSAAPEPQVGVRGIVNLGATCFFNAVIQAMNATPQLRKYMLDHDRTACTR